MKKIMTVLMGSVVLLGLASCDKNNLSSMVEGKSSAEVVSMISEKYKDKSFVAGYTNKDIKIEANANYSMVVNNVTTSMNYDFTATKDLDKGFYAKASEQEEKKSASSSSKTSSSLELDFDLQSDCLYSRKKIYYSTKSICYTNVSEALNSEKGKFPDLDLDDYLTDMPSIEDVTELLETNTDKISVAVEKKNLVLTLTTNEEINNQLAQLISSVADISYDMTDITSTCNFTFNNDLMFTGVGLSFGSYIPLPETDTDGGMKLTAGVSLSLQYGNLSYESISDKMTFVMVPLSSVFNTKLCN